MQKSISEHTTCRNLEVDVLLKPL